MIINNSNLRRDIFSKRYKILWIIIAIILVLCLIQVANKTLVEQEKQKTSQINKSTTQVATTTNKPIDTTETTYNPSQTIIQGDNVPQAQETINENTINTFIKYCNEKNAEKAYNLLTKETQQKFFSSDISNFKQNYIDKIFTSQKICSMQSWMQSGIGYTYKVRITDDLLATGSLGTAIEEYYTIVVVEENQEYKINLNNYIGKRSINKQAVSNNIVCTITAINYYMDYETYDIKIENKTKNTIILDTKQSTKSVYATRNKRSNIHKLYVRTRRHTTTNRPTDNTKHTG